ncbi:MAG: hypothetical protein Kow0062_18580 [Acidobacteriota bacterium]
MSRALRVPAAAGTVLLLAGLAACGHKGAPIPPRPRIPESPREVRVRQRGERIEFRARYVLRDLRGHPLRPPVVPVALVLGEPSPELAAGWSAGFRDREFLRRAREVELPALDPGQGAEDVVRLDALELDRLEADGHLVVSLALRDRRGRSAPSPRTVLPVARPPLAPLERLDVVPRERGVALSWAGGDDRAAAVRIYRRIEGEAGDDWRPWRVVPREEGQTVDEGVRYGQSLVYAATAALSAEGPVVESVPRIVGPLVYEDRFAPDPARDVVAVAVESGINVLWVPSRADDLELAIVERQEREDSAPWHEVGRVRMPDAFFSDRSVRGDVRYRYRVISVDRRGNRADPAGPTDWTTPRPPRDAEAPR